LISSSIEVFAAERGVRDNPAICNHASTWLMLGYLDRNENPPGLSPAGPSELLCQKGSRYQIHFRDFRNVLKSS
jgi:hypothetical protein